MLPVAMATIRLELLQGLIVKSGSFKLPIKQLKKYTFIHFHLHLLYNIDNACDYIIFVRCLY